MVVGSVGWVRWEAVGCEWMEEYRVGVDRRVLVER